MDRKAVAERLRVQAPPTLVPEAVFVDRLAALAVASTPTAGGSRAGTRVAVAAAGAAVLAAGAAYGAGAVREHTDPEPAGPPGRHAPAPDESRPDEAGDDMRQQHAAPDSPTGTAGRTGSRPQPGDRGGHHDPAAQDQDGDAIHVAVPTQPPSGADGGDQSGQHDSSGTSDDQDDQGQEVDDSSSTGDQDDQDDQDGQDGQSPSGTDDDAGGSDDRSGGLPGEGPAGEPDGDESSSQSGLDEDAG